LSSFTPFSQAECGSWRRASRDRAKLLFYCSRLLLLFDSIRPFSSDGWQPASQIEGKTGNEKYFNVGAIQKTKNLTQVILISNQAQNW